MTKTTAPRLPQRTETHRIDTLAVRKLFTKLSPDWIIRDLSERDYGIDLMLEYYTNNNPTGQVVFFQVKGKFATIELSDDFVKYQMKKQTLLYAELFPEPFLLVYTSINQTEPVFFVWLQKYISHVLDRDRPRWRDESNDTISMQFPITNTFEDAEEKLISISKSNVLLTESLKFLSTYMFWEFNYSELAQGNLDFISDCLNHLKEFKQLCTLFRKFNQNSLPDFKEVADCIETYDINEENCHHTVSQFNELLELIKSSVLTERHQEQFIEEELGVVPY